ncbi:hypothetical protein, partial [Halomonas sp. BL6]|uniref:hypothetical protein n=1 Tax=Halomonas sp. BL6 TaxID=2585770 RepID=UPI001C3F28C0
KRTKLGSRVKRIHSLGRSLFDESLALIMGDLSPSSASAHMNYLIKLLKSNFLNVAAAGSMT